MNVVLLNAVLLYIIGFILISFMIKSFNKHARREEYKIDGYIGFFIAILSWLGILFFLICLLIEKYKNWVEE